MRELSDCNILLVDDTEANIDILVETLSDEYEISVAMDGEGALEYIDETLPDLILLDIMMPGLNGYEVIQHLKDDERSREIPVIFCTAMSEAEDEQKGLELGAVDYIRKPFNPAVVKARVKTHLSLRLSQIALEDQNRELIEAARLREDVDRIMRHDLKGPLGSVIGLPGLIAESADLGPDLVNDLKIIEESGYMMLQMINLSLDLFKMERGTYELNPQPVDLVKIFLKVFAGQERIVRSKHLKMELLIEGESAGRQDVFPIIGEELLAFSLFSNLVKNAVEASPDQASVRVGLELGSEHCRVAISNQGAVPEEIRDRFFEKYATAGKSGGTGLGTYSARLMAETMNGSISLESSGEAGTTITVLVPSAASGSTREAIPISRPDTFIDYSELPDHRLLVVDDDPHSRELIVRYLNHPALSVETAEDGRQALELMTGPGNRFDLVFMDAEMPVMDGFEAARRYRAWEKEYQSESIPVIALTGHDSPEVHQKLLDAGFTNHLTKPVTSVDLFAAIKDPAGVISGGTEPEPATEDETGDTVLVDADFEGLVEEFIEDSRQTLADLPRSPEQGDLETIQRFGHTLAGTGRMYGLRHLSDRGAALESEAKMENTDGIGSLLSELEGYLARLRVEFIDEE